MTEGDARARIHRLLREREHPAEPPIPLGCDVCAQVGQRAWVAERYGRAVDLIARQGLDHPEVRTSLLGVSSDLCDLCRGYPEQAEAAAQRARALFIAAILPASAITSPMRPTPA